MLAWTIQVNSPDFVVGTHLAIAGFVSLWLRVAVRRVQELRNKTPSWIVGRCLQGTTFQTYLIFVIVLGFVKATLGIPNTTLVHWIILGYIVTALLIVFSKRLESGDLLIPTPWGPITSNQQKTSSLVIEDDKYLNLLRQLDEAQEKHISFEHAYANLLKSIENMAPELYIDVGDKTRHIKGFSRNESFVYEDIKVIVHFYSEGSTPISLYELQQQRAYRLFRLLAQRYTN